MKKLFDIKPKNVRQKSTWCLRRCDTVAPQRLKTIANTCFVRSKVTYAWQTVIKLSLTSRVPVARTAGPALNEVLYSLITLPLFFIPFVPCIRMWILELVPAPRMFPVTIWTLYTIPGGYSYMSGYQRHCQCGVTAVQSISTPKELSRNQLTLVVWHQN